MSLSLSVLDGAKDTTVVSGSWRDSPVLGFLPVRAARVLVLKVPKLARLTVNHNNAHKHADTVRQASSIDRKSVV